MRMLFVLLFFVLSTRLHAQFFGGNSGRQETGRYVPWMLLRASA